MCKFFTNIVVFFEFIVSIDGVQVDQSKIFMIVEWLTPKNIYDDWSFHGFVSFYRRFTRNLVPLSHLLQSA
jgi:hypothetical protein